MLFNFAYDFLGTTVTCNKVNVDGYECTNLTDTNFLTKKKGYIAEHFIKPPVSITFTFPCNINISHVVLDPFVGQQQCLQFDVLCATTPKARTQHGKKLQREKLLDSSQSQSSSSRDPSLQAFHVVSKMTARSMGTSMCFYSPRFNHRSGACKNPMEYENKAEMRHSKADLLINASHMTLKIVRTQRGSTPALSNVEIWGCISSSVCKDVRKIIEDKYVSFFSPERVNPSAHSLNKCVMGKEEDGGRESSHGTNGSIEDNGDSNNIEIPEEFLDPLTFEVMTIPMLLPCGKNIDKGSLDRFTDSEASHGRQPRDPFTGVEFSTNIKPIPNLDLKARIDAFLLSHSDVKSLATIPRTVLGAKSGSLLGKRNYDSLLCDGRQISSLVSTTNKKILLSNSSGKIEVVDKSMTSCPVVKSSFSSKVSCVDKSHQSSNFMSSSCTQGSVCCTSSKISDTSSRSSATSVRSVLDRGDNQSTKSHDEHLRDSLNYALSSILGSGSSSTASKGQQVQNNVSSSDRNECINCSKTLGNSSGNVAAYMSPCSHQICRKCLLSFKGPAIHCIKCGSDFQKKDVIRSH